MKGVLHEYCRHYRQKNGILKDIKIIIIGIFEILEGMRKGRWNEAKAKSKRYYRDGWRGMMKALCAY